MLGRSDWITSCSFVRGSFINISYDVITEGVGFLVGAWDVPAATYLHVRICRSLAAMLPQDVTVPFMIHVLQFCCTGRSTGVGDTKLCQLQVVYSD